MTTPKRGPLKIDLTGVDGKRKIDAEWSAFDNRYYVSIGNRRYRWTATQFASHFRKWLVRQQENSK